MVEQASLSHNTRGAPMFVRLALASDTEALAELAALDAAETMPDVPFSLNRAQEVFDLYLATGNPVIYVVEHRRQLVGFLVASLNNYHFSDRQFVSQVALYVHPRNRGSRASVLLMQQLIDWAELVGAQDIRGGNDNGFQSERTAKFIERFGFARVGYSLCKRLK